MSQETLFEASKYYSQGRYKEALVSYGKLTKIYGEKYFAANIEICNRRISEENEKTSATHRLKALTLLGRHSEACLRPEMDIESLSRDSWGEQIKTQGYDLFFVESEGRDTCFRWRDALSKKDSQNAQELAKVLSECNRKKIPTVLWINKTHKNFSELEWIGKKFEFICTVDQRSVELYKKLLGHDKVFYMPFAAQPSIHHPILQGNRDKSILVAHEWNRVQQDKDDELFKGIANPPVTAKAFEVYDHNPVIDQNGLQFPFEYREAFLPSNSLPDIAERAYRRYSAFLTSSGGGVELERDICEVAACGMPMVSYASSSLDDEFSSIVETVSDSKNLSQFLEVLVSDEVEALRHSVKGVRHIHTKHTYSDRIKLLKKNVFDHRFVSGDTLHPVRPVTAICVSKRPEMLQRIAEILNAQTHPELRLIFVTHNSDFDVEQIQKVFSPRFQTKIFHLPTEDTFLADGLNLALDHAETDLVAKIDDDDYYGPNYLFDAALAFNYSNAGLVGKNTFFSYIESINKLALRFINKHYRYTKLVQGGTLVWDRKKTGYKKFNRVRQGTDSAFLKELVNESIPILSIDPFNFIHVRYKSSNHHTWCIDDNEFLRAAVIKKDGIDTSYAYC